MLPTPQPVPPAGIPYVPGAPDFPQKSASDWLVRLDASYRLTLAAPEPWLPLCAFDSLLVIGHHNPSSTDMLGLHPDSVLKVRLSEDAYTQMRSRCLAIVAHRCEGDAPLADTCAGAASKIDLLVKLKVLQVPASSANAWLTQAPHRNDLINQSLRQRFIPLHEIHCGKEVLSRGVTFADLSTQGFIPYAEETRGDVRLIHVAVRYSSRASCPSIEELVRQRLSGSSGKPKMRVIVRSAVATDDAVRDVLAALQRSGRAGLGVNTEAVTDNGKTLDVPSDLGIQTSPSGDTPRDYFIWSLAKAITWRASDLHFLWDVNQGKGMVRLRKSGTLSTIANISREMHRGIIGVIKNETAVDAIETRFPQDGKIRARMGSDIVNLRVATAPGTPDSNGPGPELMVVRVLQRNTQLASLSDLGATQWNTEMLRGVSSANQGIIFVTGPTGSGKSSTIHLMQEQVADETVNTITIEDPVEATTPYTHHIEIHEEWKDKEGMPMSYARGLRSILRLDPDIIKLGEVRDPETADKAIQASQTGHLVITTLHTNNSLDTFARLETLKADRRLVIESTLAIQAQRLLQTLCPHCHRAQIPASPRQIAVVKRVCRKLESTLKDPVCPDGPEVLQQIQDWLTNPMLPARSNTECTACDGGIGGRRIAMEIFPTWPGLKLRDLLMEGAPTKTLMDHVVSEGYLTLELDTLRLVLSGAVSFSEFTANSPQLPSNALRSD